MKKLLLSLLLLPVLALANTATVTWTPPTTNTDGSAIPASGAGSIASYRVEWGSCVSGAFGTKAGEQVVTAPTTSLVVTPLTAGQTYCFRAYAKNTFGAESGPSSVASKLIPPPVPNPPTIVTVATVVYDVRTNGSIGRLVGRVPLGTECVGAVYRRWADGTTWHEVPRDDVTFSREARSAKVYAKCKATA